VSSLNFFEEINMHKDQKPSAGLVFMQAAAAAMPKTLGDRERVSAFDGAMLLAIRNRFAFSKHDVEHLLRLTIRTCVGVFRPLDPGFYLQACVHGGTYAKMWEAHHKQKPWIALAAIVPEHISHGFELLENNRVTMRMGVLLPESFDEHDERTIPVEGKQVWWVTTQNDEHITVCRYRLTDAELAHVGRARPFRHSGRPYRIRQLTRAQWAELNQAPAEEKQAA
jgi:hypothetical protein